MKKFEEGNGHANKRMQVYTVSNIPCSVSNSSGVDPGDECAQHSARACYLLPSDYSHSQTIPCDKSAATSVHKHEYHAENDRTRKGVGNRVTYSPSHLPLIYLLDHASVEIDLQESCTWV